MSKRSSYDRTKNRTVKQNNFAALMAMCVIAGIGSIVIGAMSNDSKVVAGTISGGLIASSIGMTEFYGRYQNLNPKAKSKRGGR